MAYRRIDDNDTVEIHRAQGVQAGSAHSCGIKRVFQQRADHNGRRAYRASGGNGNSIWANTLTHS